MPEKLTGTLTSSIIKSMHNAISLIIFCRLHSVTPQHPSCLRLKNHVRVVALMIDLQRVYFYVVTDFLSYSCTTKLTLSPKLIEGSLPSSQASLLYGRSPTALWGLWRADLHKIDMRVARRKRITGFWWGTASHVPQYSCRNRGMAQLCGRVVVPNPTIKLTCVIIGRKQ